MITQAKDMPAKTLTNNTYADSAAYLAGFSGFGGSAAMPISTGSLDRFVRASMLASATAGTSIPDSALAILDSVATPITVWSMVYALGDRVAHFRTQIVPKVKYARLADFSFACGTRKIFDIHTAREWRRPRQRRRGPGPVGCSCTLAARDARLEAWTILAVAALLAGLARRRPSSSRAPSS